MPYTSTVGSNEFSQCMHTGLATDENLTSAIGIQMSFNIMSAVVKMTVNPKTWFLL